MKNGILVFASKRVGLECVAHLLNSNTPIERVVVGTAADRELLDLVISRRIHAEVYTKETQSQLVVENHHYRWLLNI